MARNFFSNIFREDRQDAIPGLFSEFQPQFLFKFLETIVAEESHARVSVIADRQVTAEGLKFPAFDAIKSRFGSEGRADNFFPDVSGINDRVQELAFVKLQGVSSSPSSSSSCGSSMILPITS